MDAEDPLFILYTSGSTGKPKGVMHTTGGYMVYASMTHQYIFDYKPKDVYWCTADIGWVTGHSYIIYGPFSNAATTIMFEGIPNYPDSSRWWQVIDKYKVNIFYTAPTAIRALIGVFHPTFAPARSGREEVRERQDSRPVHPPPPRPDSMYPHSHVYASPGVASHTGLSRLSSVYPIGPLGPLSRVQSPPDRECCQRGARPCPARRAAHNHSSVPPSRMEETMPVAA